MSQLTETPSRTFFDRRDHGLVPTPPMLERRQFANSHDDLSPAARELALAVDEYKVRHRRRFITFEELLNVVTHLGYRK
jgi:hypothetical protein